MGLTLKVPFAPVPDLHMVRRTLPIMLTENDVVRHLCAHLSANGYHVHSQCDTNKAGVDIVAERQADKRILRVEAKGGTSSKSHTLRFGKPFDSGQVLSHVSRAFYTAAALQSLHPGGEVAIALPDDKGHAECVGKIMAACQRLDIAVYLVDTSGDVRRMAFTH
ncbi:MAG: hypothetical protein ACREJO_16790 [Phycisphaerales bacterium]